MRASPKPLIFQSGLLFLSLVLVGGVMAAALREAETQDPSGCQPTFSDDFTAPVIDAQRWNTAYKSGRTELQYYAPDAFELGTGRLRIRADARPQAGYPYSSGILTTQTTFSQQYGYFEIRARLPRGQGLWPAFWLLHTGPAPWTEIDVFENLGHDPNKLYLYNHWRNDANQPEQLPQTYTGTDFSAGYHTFAIDWQPGRLTWYVDGVKRAETDQHVPEEPMFMLVNLAVGGTWPGSPDATTHFPAYLAVDYVRVYPAYCQPPERAQPLTPTASTAGPH